MKRLLSIVALVVVALFVSCSNNSVVRDTEPIYTPRYAKGFAIERDKTSGELLLCVKNPWQGAENVAFYTKIDTVAPPKRIIAMSSSHSAMLEAVECGDRVVGLSGCCFISSPAMIKAIEEGEIFDVGYDSSLDFERIVSLKADVVLLYGVAGEAKTMTNKFDELGIPYIYIGDYLEDSPLGKAEWVVAISYLCGVEDEGKAFFAGVEERYNTLRASVSATSRPRVMLNLPYRDTWFMPPHNSYMVRLIEDAGGEYILTENGKRKTENEKLKTRNEDLSTLNSQLSTKSTPISLEEALVLASRSDYWLNLGQVNSLEELKAAAPRFMDIKSVRAYRIYNNTKRTNSGGGSDFWESGAVRPDLILKDLVQILHHDAPTEELYYYRKLE